MQLLYLLNVQILFEFVIHHFIRLCGISTNSFRHRLDNAVLTTLTSQLTHENLVTCASLQSSTSCLIKQKSISPEAKRTQFIECIGLEHKINYHPSTPDWFLYVKRHVIIPNNYCAEFHNSNLHEGRDLLFLICCNL